MTKFFLGIAIVGFTTFCGYLLSKKYRKRKTFFTEFYQFNEHFLTEITYYRRPIIDWIDEKTYKGDFSFLIHEYARRVTGQMLIYGMVTEDTSYAFLKAEEKTATETYFSTLGKGDTLSQKNYFSAEREHLLSLRKTAEDEAKKYGDLYIKIGFLFGLFILIIII